MRFLRAVSIRLTLLLLLLFPDSSDNPLAQSVVQSWQHLGSCSWFLQTHHLSVSYTHIQWDNWLKPQCFWHEYWILVSQDLHWGLLNALLVSPKQDLCAAVRETWIMLGWLFTSLLQLPDKKEQRSSNCPAACSQMPSKLLATRRQWFEEGISLLPPGAHFSLKACVPSPCPEVAWRKTPLLEQLQK